VIVRLAEPRDVPRIHGLLRAAFGDTMLPYSVYQAEESAIHLGEVIARSADDDRFWVLDEAGDVAGFHEARIDGRHGFLSFIALAPERRGSGLGSLLLEHFESSCASRGCGSAGLHVVRSETSAFGWYLRRGYREVRASYSLRMALPEIEGGDRCEVDAARLEAALREERRRGFSKVTCDCDGAPVVVGLIAGSSCRLLEHLGVPLRRACSCAAALFGSSRSILIATGQSELPADLPIVGHQHIASLEKRL